VKLLIWTSIPNHNQAAFFSAIRSDGVDLVVHYYRAIPKERLKLGWDDPSDLPPGERRVPARISSIKLCDDWKARVHVLPGCGRPFLFSLAVYCSLRGLMWMHWSEQSNPNSKWRLGGNIVRRCYAIINTRYGNGALAISESARKDFINWGIRPDRIRLLPYSTSTVRSGVTRARRPATAGNVHFLFLGVLNARKAVDVLLAAFARVSAQYPNSTLTLVGHDQSRGAYQRLAKSLGIDSNVQFSGSVLAASIGDVLAQYDVLVLPSRFDGWGMVLSEAASMGLALIGSDMCGATHHLIKNGNAGYRVTAGDVQSLAEAMSLYCSAPETIALHGARSRALFADLAPEKNSTRLQVAVRDLCYPV
jgi:glycosyltransferase involved in cell wall biosynthesis